MPHNWGHDRWYVALRGRRRGELSALRGLGYETRWALMARAAGARSGSSWTVTHRSVSQAAPPPGTNKGGSRQAITTRRTPAAKISSAQGVGREARAEHGSSEL